MSTIRANGAELPCDDGIDTAHVRAEELKLILATRRSQIGARNPKKNAQNIDERAWSSGLFGLALSGGGIRSATFNLGVLQALAERRLLRHIDYLSTVSGGGYIGGWLTGLLQREHYRIGMENRKTRTEAGVATGNLSSTGKAETAVANIETRIGNRYSLASSYDVPEDPAITHLRSYSNYLTPTLGFFSADTWALITTYLRNVLLNQTILILAISAMLLLPWLVASIFAISWEEPVWPWLDPALLSSYLLGLVLLLAWFLARSRAKEDEVDEPRKKTSGEIVKHIPNWLPRLLWVDDDETGWSLLFRYLLVALLIEAGIVAFAFDAALVVAILGLAAVAAWHIGQNVAAVADTDPAKPNPHGTSHLIIGALGPLILAAVLITAWLPNLNTLTLGIIHSLPAIIQPSVRLRSVLEVLIPAFVVMPFYFLLWYVARVSAKRAFTSGWVPMDDWPTWKKRWRRIVASGGGSAAILGVGLYFINEIVIAYPGYHMKVWLAPPLVLLSILLAESFHIGLASAALKSQQREWLSRLGAWVMILVLGWLGFAGIAFVGPFLVQKAFASEYLGQLITTGWVGTTIAGLIAGRGTKERETPGWLRNALVAVTPYVFVLGLLMLLAAGVQLVLAWYADLDSIGLGWALYWHDLNNVDNWFAILVALVVVGIFVRLFSRRFDVNEFSLHRMYENRLTRCYLGATTECRFKNPFTGFSMQDDMPLWTKRGTRRGSNIVTYQLGLFDKELTELPLLSAPTEDWEPGSMVANIPGSKINNDALTAKERRDDVANELATYYPGPYPIINTAINLVGGPRLAWQERKAAPFILSPLYCGFQLSSHARDDLRCCDNDAATEGCNYCLRRFLDDVVAAGGAIETIKQRRCPFYPEKAISTCLESTHKRQRRPKRPNCYRQTDKFAKAPFELTLGDAIATSGAAASPNMGYHSTPALAFLLSVFNIRLGRWIGNPLKTRWRKSGPRFALWWLLSEVFGRTNDDADYVYLSDGGHFENLGIYELARRRCRYIIACDATADGDYSFEDLAITIRKCRIDLGVDIDIDVSDIANTDENKRNSAPCAVGDIRYPEGHTGMLLYIKPTRLANVPTDVLQYATEHAWFPHENTVDQFFSETQFESYRQLGQHICSHALADSLKDIHSHGSGYIAEMFRELRRTWHRRTTPAEDHFTELCSTLNALYKELRTDPNLDFLHKQFYPEWQVRPGGKAGGAPSFDTVRMRPKQCMSRIPDDKFQAGFHFCNSMIQFAECAYIRMKLEQQYDHPDNAGWMNLFRLWSWSSMFRVTWTISASTHSRRFVEFCKRHLELEIGRVELTRVRCERGTCTVFGDDDRSGDPSTLNPFELMEIDQKLRDNCGDEKVVYQLDLVVDNRGLANREQNETEPLLKFSFGYAIVIDRCLIQIRVQDHLRRMQLGRLALLELLKIWGRKLTFKDDKDLDRFKKIFEEMQAEAGLIDTV